jgi:phosphatidylinositol alpha-1,6-mannosyltransferase
MTFRASRRTLSPASGITGVTGILGPAGLGVVTLRKGPDGIAYVGRLLERALAEITGHPPDVVALDPLKGGQVSPGEKLRFATRMAHRQVGGSPEWWLFNHLGIARVQNYLPQLARKPYGVFLMGIEAWDPEIDEIRRRCLTDARTLIAISNHTARRALETHPHLTQITTCHLALLPEEEDGEVDASILSKVSSRSTLIVGRMSAAERYKGHDQLLEAWPRVVASYPDAQLIVAGNGDDAERLQAKAVSIGIGDSVLFTGFVNGATLEAMMKKVALFAMPSRNEGFGLVYLEAMRSGLPCIGSNVDAACEIIADGETGRLVNPDDVDLLAQSVTDFFSDDEMRKAMGEAARNRFNDVFRFEHFIDRLRPILVSSFASGDVDS